MKQTPFSTCLRCLVVCLVTAGFSVQAAEKDDAQSKSKSKRKRPITKLSYDESAEKVALFDGIENGQFEATLLPKNPHQGSVLIENKTDEPLTVELPKSFIGVQVLKQFGGGCPGGGLGGGCPGGGGGLGGGGGQSVGGGFGGGGLGGGGLGGGGLGGGGLFSIPPEKVVKVNYQSVCLEHGKLDPMPRMNYRLVKTEEYTENAVLLELLEIVGTRRVDLKAAQAAAWHLTDQMSWRELASKQVERLGGVGNTPYFSRNQLLIGQNIIAVATEQAKSEEDKDAEEKADRPTRRTRRTSARAR